MVIKEFDENWKNQFKDIKSILEANLSEILRVEHVGSTAINGMYAKPVIDVIIVIGSEETFEKTKKELESIGYYHNGDQGIIGREVFKRNKVGCSESLDTIVHHLYVCTEGNDELVKEVKFRDYLNKNLESRGKYNDIKKDIIRRVGNENRSEYISIKSTEYNWFFDEINKRAEREYSKEH